MGTRTSVTLFLLLAAVLQGCAPEGPPPNIVVITIDTLRADRVGAPGLTPHIDALAAESAVFENAITPIGTTGPAHASLFTGLYPRAHGVRWNCDRLRKKFPTLAGMLSENGYETAAFVSWPHLIKEVKLGRGFEVRSDNRDTPPHVRPGAAVNRKAAEWLDKARERPFFLWLHYYEVHTPYRLTDHARKQFEGYDGPYAEGATTDLFHAYGSKELPATAENRAAMNILYDGEVVEADLLVEEVLKKLESSGLRNDTVIVVTSDHGQLLGEHGTRGHGGRVWEEVLRIPLVVHDPRRDERPRIATRVSLLDLFPTVLEYARLPIPEDTPGRSLVSAIRGEPLGETLYLAETRTSDQFPQLVAAMEGPRKVIVASEGVRAFDLQSDPAEEEPVSFGRSDVLAKLARIAKVVLETGSSTPSSEGLDEETLEHLRSLGYAE
jgi:choline-sulfatase